MRSIRQAGRKAALRGRAWRGGVLVAVAGVACAIGFGPTAVSDAASSTVTVAMTVSSASTLATGGCAPGSSATNFGTVLPGAGAVTATDCSLTWGSTNDTAMLRLYQGDGVGKAMYRVAQGPLDPAFDGDATMPGYPGNGFVRTDINGTDEAEGGVMQSDGKLVVFGRNGGNGGQWTLARYTSTGVLDTGFDTDGTLDLDFGANNEAPKDAVAQPDGKILVVGYSIASENEWALARFNANGALDPSFDGDATMPGYPGNGKIRFPFGSAGELDSAWAVDLMPDGRFVVSGHVGADFAIARFNADGSLDTTFDGDGKVTVAISAYEEGEGVAVAPDGSVVVAGYTTTGSNEDVALLRLTSTGALDPAFDGDASMACYPCNGKLSHPVGTGDDFFVANNVVIQTDGDIIAAGVTDVSGAGRAMVAAYNADGSRDTSFGGGSGRTLLPTGSLTNVWSAAIDELPDGSLIVGYGADVGSGVHDVVVARLTDAGVLMPEFDTDGVLTIVDAGDENFQDVVPAPDGKLLAVYRDTPGASLDFRIAQFDAVTVPDYQASSADWGTAGASLFAACLRSASNAVTGGAGWAADADTTGDEAALSADCGDGDADPWKPVVQTGPTAGAKVASTTSGVSNAVANFRFGFRAAGAQDRGTYIAPAVFEVIAPNA